MQTEYNKDSVRRGLQARRGVRRYNCTKEQSLIETSKFNTKKVNWIRRGQETSDDFGTEDFMIMTCIPFAILNESPYQKKST